MPALLEERYDGIDVGEMHWSTGTILAIFFAASLVSAVFFGLGYSFGRGGTGLAASGKLSALNSTFASGMERSAFGSASKPDSREPAIFDQAASRRDAKESPSAMAVGTGDGQRSHADLQAPAVHRASSPSQPAHPAAVQTGTQTMVQIGAIGNRRDAERLVAQLRRRGFRAGIYPSKRDKFLHVQMGPFATAEQAQRARRRAIARGYHAILKHST